MRANAINRDLAMLIVHSDLRLDEIYSFSLEHAHSRLGAGAPIEVLEGIERYCREREVTAIAELIGTAQKPARLNVAMTP